MMQLCQGWNIQSKVSVQIVDLGSGTRLCVLQSAFSASGTAACSLLWDLALHFVNVKRVFQCLCSRVCWLLQPPRFAQMLQDSCKARETFLENLPHLKETRCLEFEMTAE